MDWREYSRSLTRNIRINFYPRTKRTRQESRRRGLIPRWQLLGASKSSYISGLTWATIGNTCARFLPVDRGRVSRDYARVRRSKKEAGRPPPLPAVSDQRYIELLDSSMGREAA